LFSQQIIRDLFRAYYDARRHKHGSDSALAFELNYESNLLTLARELADGIYQVGPSTCFVVKKPCRREVFAADFRDRVVHHLIFNYISPLFERTFIYDSYSCRVGKGTSLGIKRCGHFIRSCSRNYARDCHILKLDIQGYFMSIDKRILYGKIERVVKNYAGFCPFDKTWLLALIHQVAFNDPTKNCVIKGKREDWFGLPKSKSLFFSKPDCGLPIGNLTSQLFANIYLDDFDHFVKNTLGKGGYYGRYVDDMVIVHQDKEYLKSVIPLIRNYLSDKLSLTLHPKKIYLQHYKMGVAFLGAILKPYRQYILNRTKGNCLAKIRIWNKIVADNNGKLSEELLAKFTASLNSYLGMMKQFNTYKLRKKILTEYLSPELRQSIIVAEDGGKISKP